MYSHHLLRSRPGRVYNLKCKAEISRYAVSRTKEFSDVPLQLSDVRNRLKYSELAV